MQFLCQESVGLVPLFPVWFGGAGAAELCGEPRATFHWLEVGFRRVEEQAESILGKGGAALQLTGFT